MGSWTGAEGRPGVMLEDDVEVSALWWHWAQAGISRYAHLPAVVGVSLFTPDDMNEAYENGGTNGAGGWEPSCGWQSRYYRRSAAHDTASAVLFGQPCCFCDLSCFLCQALHFSQPRYLCDLSRFLCKSLFFL